MTRLSLAALVFVGTVLAPAAARAQFVPEAGPGREEQELTTTVLLGPEATVLGALLGGAATYGVEKNFFTAKGKDPAVAPIAVGAGVGAAIGASWAQWSISSHYHPGSRVYAALGASLGAAVGSAVYFGGPSTQPSNERVLRVLTFLLGPSLCAYGGWHLGGEDAYFDDAAAPAPVWADHLWSDVPRATPVLQSVSIRF